MKLIGTAACLLLIGALAACGQSDAANGAAGSPVPDLGDQVDPAIVAELPISSRSFRMGTAGFVPAGYPESSDEQWRQFLTEGAAGYGGLFGVHVSPSAPKNEAGVPEQVQLAFEQMQGVDPYVALAVNHEDGPFTQARGEELVRVARAVAAEHQPGFLSLGVESNSLFLFQQDTFDLYVQYANQAYDEVKAVSPDTMVMNNFQLERMKGATDLTGQDFEPHWHLIDRFAGKLDLVSFTVYPFLHYAAADQIPGDYLAEMRQHSALPVMITETGWPTEELPNGVAGSDQAQIQYLLDLARQADELDAVAVIWVFPHDGEFDLAGGIFDHISLRDNEGGPKPAYEYWRALHSLPRR